MIDSQADVVQLEWSVFLNDEIYTGPETMDVDMQDKISMTFEINITIDGWPPDTYTLYVKAIDATGRESDEIGMPLFVE